MKIIVAGGLGHIGSYFIRDISGLFEKVIIIDNLRTQRYCSLFNLDLNKNKFLNEDLTTYDISHLIEEGDIVLNLAAITDATSSIINKDEVENNNLKITENLALSSAKKNAKFIFISSTSVYGSQKEIVDENSTDDDLNPQSPYAETKLKEEALVKKFISEYNLKACIFRFGTIYGTSPGIRFHTAVNKFCWQASFGIPLTVWKDNYHQMRPYLDLKDASNSIKHVINNNLFHGETYNVLTNNLRVSDIIEIIEQHVPNLEIQFVDSPIMNQLSYEVSSKKFKETSFKYLGSPQIQIANTLNLFK